MTRGSSNGRSPTRRSTSSCGSRTPAGTAPPTTGNGTRSGWRGSRPRTSRGSASAGSRCAGGRCPKSPGRPYAPDRAIPARRHTSGSRSGRAPWPSRWVLRSLAGSNAVDLLRAYDDKSLLDARLELAPDVDQEQLGRPGAAHPEHVILRQRTGLCRAVRVDTAEAGFVGACDGSLTAGQIVDALATLLEEDADALRDRLLPRVREFVEEGYLSLSAAPG